MDALAEEYQELVFEQMDYVASAEVDKLPHKAFAVLRAAIEIPTFSAPVAEATE